MGFIKNNPFGLIGTKLFKTLMGDGEDDRTPAPASTTTTTTKEDTGKTAAQIEKERQQKAVRANAGRNNAFDPLSTNAEPASVTSKTLLGL